MVSHRHFDQLARGDMGGDLEPDEGPFACDRAVLGIKIGQRGQGKELDGSVADEDVLAADVQSFGQLFAEVVAVVVRVEDRIPSTPSEWPEARGGRFPGDSRSRPA